MQVFHSGRCIVLEKLVAFVFFGTQFLPFWWIMCNSISFLFCLISSLLLLLLFSLASLFWLCWGQSHRGKRQTNIPKYKQLTYFFMAAAPEKEWNKLLINGMTVGKGDVSPEEFYAVIKKRIERTLIRTVSIHWTQVITVSTLESCIFPDVILLRKEVLTSSVFLLSI